MNKVFTVAIPRLYGDAHSFVPAVVGTAAPVVQDVVQGRRDLGGGRGAAGRHPDACSSSPGGRSRARFAEGTKVGRSPARCWRR